MYITATLALKYIIPYALKYITPYGLIFGFEDRR